MITSNSRLAESFEEPIYAIARPLIGALFIQHGAQKLIGLFGGVDGSGATASLMSIYGVVGIIEFVGGFLIAIGILTRLIALIAIGEIIAAQFIAHLPGGFAPIQNRVELGFLYIAVFLLLVVHGNGYCSLNRQL